MIVKVSLWREGSKTGRSNEVERDGEVNLMTFWQDMLRLARCETIIYDGSGIVGRHVFVINCFPIPLMRVCTVRKFRGVSFFLQIFSVAITWICSFVVGMFTT